MGLTVAAPPWPQLAPEITFCPAGHGASAGKQPLENSNENENDRDDLQSIYDNEKKQ